ncbi:MAG: acyl-CoA thioesterase [Thermomicrobiales bacterium]|nr:acyl-CoA thioesterase [Thermomicrobiales bacterium]
MAAYQHPDRSTDDLEEESVDDGRSPSESAVTLGQLMLPNDANPSGDVHGGVVMMLVDTAAGLAAMRHSRSRSVTVAMDYMTFEAPVHVGDLVHLNAIVTWTGRTSMEIEVVVEAEDILAGTRVRTSKAHLVYVALDEEGRPKPVPALIPSTDEERERWAAAERRRAARLGA